MGADATSPTNFVRMKTGTYTGDGLDDRDIDIGVNLLAKSQVYIVIKPNAIYDASHRIEYGQGDLTMTYGPIADVANVIQGLTSTGFTVGDSGAANLNVTVYRYIVLWTD